MYKEILTAILVLGGIGLLFAIILAISGIFFEVKKDERVVMIREALPGANCGACGYAGCDAYAEAIASGNAKANLCIPGTNVSAEKIGKILGIEVEKQKTRAMRVMCCKDVTETFDYVGIKTCAGEAAMFRGANSCNYSCLGKGDCVAACPNNAIMMRNGIPIIDANICTECGLCAKACPKGLIKYVIGDYGYYVACSSRDTGKVTKANCKNGCIGCRICEKKCEYDAIHVENNVASIDYEKCTACGKCAETCPVKVIKKYCVNN
ncbi:MAG: RnfABCDGE type electron transport complex subunit B [Clostridia bacterium]